MEASSFSRACDRGQSAAPTVERPGAREAALAGKPRPLRWVVKVLGPGLIAGASDDDPATIGTCAQIGAALGFATLWTMPVTLPLMAAVQFINLAFSVTASTDDAAKTSNEKALAYCC